LEVGLIALGWWVLRPTLTENARPKLDHCGIALVLLQTGTSFGPLPPTLVALALSALGGYAFFTGLAWRVDRYNPR
jgi:hypothetical protein